MKRALAGLVVLASLPVISGAANQADAAACRPRTLVVSAMPVELSPLLAQTTATTIKTVDGHDYYLGRLRGHDVVLTLTGIGPVNATRTTSAALVAFRCGPRSGIDAVVFSGVAGGDYIGDVIVPTRWTLDAGKHTLGVSPRLLAAARKVASTKLALETIAPAGDPACGCVTSPDAVTTVAVTHAPQVEVGGTGQTTDPFGGRSLPCAPGGGDVFGCTPCTAQTAAARDGERFVPGVVPFVDPAFFSGYAAASASEGPGYVVQDEETAAVDAVATAKHLPFLGIRAVSDGGGDPLGLPGFPAQFFYYRQLAADNAAVVTEALLAALR